MALAFGAARLRPDRARVKVNVQTCVWAPGWPRLRRLQSDRQTTGSAWGKRGASEELNLLLLVGSR